MRDPRAKARVGAVDEASTAAREGECAPRDQPGSEWCSPIPLEIAKNLCSLRSLRLTIREGPVNRRERIEHKENQLRLNVLAFVILVFFVVDYSGGSAAR